MNVIVLVLSLMLIVWISIDTFHRVNLLTNHSYMQFQLWVCIFFIFDFFIGLILAKDKWRYIRHRIVFLILSIPYLNIINMFDIHLSAEAVYFARFIPLLRGALALTIVIGYISSNAITNLFISYLTILLFVVYFCSLIFYKMEVGVNPQVTSYWKALWWAAMNVSTVGCNISPVSIAGHIVAVILPICGTIIFPLFTVYLTDFVARSRKKATESRLEEESN